MRRLTNKRCLREGMNNNEKARMKRADKKRKEMRTEGSRIDW
jgi:hypothetical protein